MNRSRHELIAGAESFATAMEKALARDGRVRHVYECNVAASGVRAESRRRSEKPLVRAEHFAAVFKRAGWVDVLASEVPVAARTAKVKVAALRAGCPAFTEFCHRALISPR